MQVMVDLNVLLDVVQRREPHFGASAEIMAMAARGQIQVLLPSHNLATLHYIVAKHAGRTRADSAVDWVLSNLRIHATDHVDCLRARTIRMLDFEDAMVAASAEAARCRYIVTRNVRDFSGSPVSAITPEEFLAERNVPGNPMDI
jgi:predicted nucleic acid-binding protein